ncbi:MAG: type II toxin-antitoxin system YafQ family toxin [Burkholderiales bacterium]|jgi:mRNA interferase YafQ|nr:type II toxin-antitoxin system YafQ family toxin [Burkholderiales bacterium]
MLSIVLTNKMRRDIRLMKKRGKDLEKLQNVLTLLANRKELSPALRDHKLTGNLKDFRECHIEPDWLLLYRIEEKELILIATATGTHADLLGM